MIKNLKKYSKNSNGITLIALVVTIIVLLILAGISISMLSGDNGILQKATTAKTETEKSQEQEIVALAYNSALAKKVGNGDSTSVTSEDMNTELANQGATASGSNPIKVTFTDSKRQYTISTNGIIKYSGIKSDDDDLVIAGNKAITTIKDNYKDLNEKRATIPAGFTVSNIDGEKNIDEGLVIYLIPDEVTPDWTTKATGESFEDNTIYEIQTKYDQFVWVPVSNINKMVMCKNNNKDGHTCNIQLNSEKTSLICTESGANSELCGKLYSIYDSTTYSFTTFDKTLSTQKWDTSSNREPDFLTDFDNNSRYNNNIMTLDGEDGINAEFIKMAISVAKYGGFWIGRYESSLVNSKTRQIAGQTSMNAIQSTSKYWYGLYTRQKSFASDNNIAGVVSSQMIWGCQYDAMMNWMAEDSSIDVTSYPPKTGTSYNSSRITGATIKSNTSINDKIKNIYDLTGNSVEWTQEAIYQYSRGSRGGYHYESNSPNNRWFSDSPDIDNENTSSRPTLYIK